MHPHSRALLVAFAVTAVSGTAFLALMLVVLRGDNAGRTRGLILYGLTALAGIPAVFGGLALVFLLGLAVNGGSYERVVLDEAGVRRIERRAMWGRRGMCLGWGEDGSLDLAACGYYDGDRKVAPLVFEADAVGFRDQHGRRGPWLFFDASGRPDPERSGWYDRDRPVRVEHPERFGLEVPPGSIRPLPQDELEDLLSAWESR